MKMKEKVKRVFDLIVTKGAPEGADADVLCGFEDNLDQYMRAIVKKNAVHEWI